MEQVTTIGLDLAKSVFQVHGVDAGGAVVVIKKLRREKVLAFFKTLAPCLVGMEACGTAHYWAREIGALGHTVKLTPAKYVKAYVKRGKSDAADAAAICEAAPRPSMRPVPVKTAQQQSACCILASRAACGSLAASNANWPWRVVRAAVGPGGTPVHGPGSRLFKHRAEDVVLGPYRPFHNASWLF